MIYQSVYKTFAVLSLSVLCTAPFSAVVIPSFLCHVLVGPDLGHSGAHCGFGFRGPVLRLRGDSAADRIYDGIGRGFQSTKESQILSSAEHIK